MRFDCVTLIAEGVKPILRGAELFLEVRDRSLGEDCGIGRAIARW